MLLGSVVAFFPRFLAKGSFTSVRPRQATSPDVRASATGISPMLNKKHLVYFAIIGLGLLVCGITLLAVADSWIGNSCSDEAVLCRMIGVVSLIVLLYPIYPIRIAKDSRLLFSLHKLATLLLCLAVLLFPISLTTAIGRGTAPCTAGTRASKRVDATLAIAWLAGLFGLMNLVLCLCTVRPSFSEWTPAVSRVESVAGDEYTNIPYGMIDRPPSVTDEDVGKGSAANDTIASPGFM